MVDDPCEVRTTSVRGVVNEEVKAAISRNGIAVSLAPTAGEMWGTSLFVLVRTPKRLAVNFLDLLSADHHAIDDEVYRELGEVFTAAQIIELGFMCANAMGLHRFIHTLDVFGTSAPVIAYAPDQVDTEFAIAPEQASA